MNDMTIAQRRTYLQNNIKKLHSKSSTRTQCHIIKKRTNNKVSYIEFMLDTWQL